VPGTFRTVLLSLPPDRPYVWKGAVTTVGEMLDGLDQDMLRDSAAVERDGSILVSDHGKHPPLLVVRLRCVDCSRPSERLRDGVPACDACSRRPGA
jgi:hypothetical protein